MSNKGIFTALSGAMAQNSRMETIANNIANSGTTGFKKDKQVFNEYLTANEKIPDVIQVPKIPASIESFYHMQGGDKGYVNASETYTDFTQGLLKPTGNVLDVALEGEGFMEVQTPSGVRLTRSGSLKVDSEGRLVTSQGYPVLLEGAGQDPEGRQVNLNSRNVTISYSGEIYEGGELVGQLSAVNVLNKDSLQKVGSNMYQLKPNYAEELTPAAGVQFHQGYVEGSNVNIVSEMTDMIAASRAFESTQETIKAFDQMNDKLVNQVPKT